MVFIKVMVPSSRLILTIRQFDPYDQIYDVEALKKRKHKEECKWLSY